MCEGSTPTTSYWSTISWSVTSPRSAGRLRSMTSGPKRMASSRPLEGYSERADLDRIREARAGAWWAAGNRRVRVARNKDRREPVDRLSLIFVGEPVRPRRVGVGRPTDDTGKHEGDRTGRR